MRTSIIISLICLSFCRASSLLEMVDYFFGYGPSNSDVMHAIGSINSNPYYQCRAVLNILDRPTAPILLNVLPKMDELLTETKEFTCELSPEEQYDIIKFYIYNMQPSRADIIEGKAISVLLTIIYQEQAYALLNLAISKGFLSTKDLLIFFMKNIDIFSEALDAGVLVHLDITIPIFLGRGILHVFAEKGYINLCEKIISHLPPALEENIKMNYFTDVEGNSLLHSAVLSNNPKMISLMARHFNRLCGHSNNFGWSPFKLSLLNGNTYESLKALLDLGCVADGEKVSMNPIAIPTLDKYYDFQDVLEKAFKWSPALVSEFREVFNGTCHSFEGQHNFLDEFKFFGLLNSYAVLNSKLDVLHNVDFIKNSSIIKPPSYFLTNNSQSVECVRKSTDLCTVFSSDSFDPLDHRLQNVSLSHVIDGMIFNYSSKEIKSTILKNLAKIDSFDLNGTALSRFIQTLVQYAEPAIFAHFVNKHIDFYFCVRSLFKTFHNYDSLIPYLDAIGFEADVPFVDGLYPIHLAAQTDNLNLLMFLVKNYKVPLDTLTVYENNSVLHYGLSDRNSHGMIEFLLTSVSELLELDNNFHVTPLHLALFRTRKMEIVSKLMNAAIEPDIDFEHSEEVESVFEELTKLWPSKSVGDRASKLIFESLFRTCGSDETSRFLLTFLSKKLFKHFINENAPTWLLSGYKNFELRIRSRSSSSGQQLSNTSPVSIDHSFSSISEDHF